MNSAPLRSLNPNSAVSPHLLILLALFEHERRDATSVQCSEAQIASETDWSESLQCGLLGPELDDLHVA